MKPRFLRSRSQNKRMQSKFKTKGGLENRRQLTSTPTHFNLGLSTQNNPFSLYPVGSELEVSSDEEGFTGAWYLATIIESPSSSSSSSSSSSFSPTLSQQLQRRRKLFVEYKNLLAEENGSALLKEYVDVAFVRPRPPLDKEDELSFEVNAVVDAYYQDGWWTGVVTQLVGKGRNCRYKVFFCNPPDELEFGKSDLRVHGNWVDGKWVYPEKKRMRELNFSRGTAVEVNIDPDVWCPATFIRQVANNCLLVEYQKSQDAGPQQVAVDSFHIRPSPPPSSNKAFSLLEKVDAFYDFRWLSGVVTKILADGRYIVYFKRTKKEKELSHSDLRLHMEWTNGKWVHSLQDTPITSISEKQSEYAVNGGYKEKFYAPARGADAKEDGKVAKNSTVTLKSSQKLLQAPASQKADKNSTMPSNKRTKQTNSRVDFINLNSSRRPNEKTISDAPLSPESSGKLRLKQTEELHNGTLVALDSYTPGDPGRSSLKPSEDSNQSTDAIENTEDGEKHSSLRKRGRPRKREKPLKLRVLPQDAVDQTRNGNSVFSPYGPIVIGLTHNGKMIEPLSGISGVHKKGESSKAVKLEERHSNTEGNHESVSSEQQKDGEVTNLKRKRGRPPKILFRVGSPMTKEAELLVASKDSVSETKGTAETVNEVEEPVAGAESAGISDSTTFSVTSRRKHLRIISDHPRGFHALNAGSVTKKPVSKGLKSPKEMVTVEASELVKPVALKRGRRQKSTKQVEPSTEDAGERTTKVLNNGVVRNVETVAGTSSNVSDDDRPLSAWFEGAHSPPTTDGRVPVAATAGQCDGTGERREGNKMQHVGQSKDKAQEKQDESVAAENVLVDNDAPERQDQSPTQSTAIVPVDNQELPFVKNSLIWKMIESMEVLKQIPQKPHFRPLYNCKEECREGLAIGNMVTFTSLVDRISRLQFSDPKSLVDGYLAALTDLEELGFNVVPVSDRLNTLLSIKGRYEHSQNTGKEIETQIVERDHEKSKINEDIAELDKQIAELNEKRALAVSKKEMKEAEIRLLQSSVDAVKGSLESAKEEFEKVAASLW